MSRPGILSACYTFPEDDVSSSTAALLVHLWQMEMDGQIYVKDDAAPPTFEINSLLANSSIRSILIEHFIIYNS